MTTAPAAWLVFVLAVPAWAQASPQLPSPADAAPFVVRRWDARDGLPQNSINDIAQTPDGYLWLATFGGLARFDGVRFTLFSSRTHSGMASDRALALAVDGGGRLWIGTENGLVVRDSGGAFRTFTSRDGLPDNLVSRLFADSRGTVWASLPGFVVRVVDGVRGPAIRTPGSLVNVADVLEDDRGAVWLRSDAGLARWYQDAGVFVPESTILRPGEALGLAGRDPRGGMWLVTPTGLARWARGSVTRFGRRDGVPRGATRLAGSRDGTFWIVSPLSGLWHFDPAERRARHYGLPDDTAAYAGRSVFVDRAGTAWGGTNVDGLLGLRRRVGTVLPLVQRGAVSATAILGDAGRVFIGANCDTVNVFMRGRLALLRMPGRRSVSCVWSLARDTDGALWLGTWGDYAYHLAGTRLTQFGPAQGLRGDVVLALHRARDGTLWIGSLAHGLLALRGGSDAVWYDTASGLPDNRVSAIVETPEALWIGTAGGLVRLAGGRSTSFTTADGLAHNYVRAILPDSGGVLWIGSYGGGVARYRNGVFRAITSAGGLHDDNISAIIDDGRGSLWFNSNHHIFRVAKRSLHAFADGDSGVVRSVVYGEADGLSEIEGNGGFQPAAWRAPDGRIWFPTIRGVAIVDPLAAVPDTIPPRAAVEEIVVDGRAVPLRAGVHVPLGSGNVEIRYSALGSPAPEALIFRYRLDGGAWAYAGTRRAAEFPRLGSGRHSFAVAAATRDGVWGEAASLRFALHAPLWARWWFRPAVAAALLAVVGLFVRFRLAQRDYRAEQAFARRVVAGQEAERKRIASELHDGIGQDLLVIKNRADLALRTTAVGGKAREQLEQISGIAAESLRHTRVIAHGLRPPQLDRLGLATAVRSTAEQAGAASGIAFSVTTQDVDGRLSPEAEIGLFRVVQESINNILKHAGASSAEIRLEAEGDSIRLLVRDDGRGFATEAVRAAAEGGGGGGYGLRGMQERVKLMGGTLELRSASGTGVTLVARIPLRPNGGDLPA